MTELVLRVIDSFHFAVTTHAVYVYSVFNFEILAAFVSLEWCVIEYAFNWPDPDHQNLLLGVLW